MKISYPFFFFFVNKDNFHLEEIKWRPGTANQHQQEPKLG